MSGVNVGSHLACHCATCRSWRRLSIAQQRFLEQCILKGPQIVTAKTKRTAEVLLSRWLMVEYRGPNRRLGPPRRPSAGSVLRATGKAWEAYRAIHGSPFWP